MDIPVVKLPFSAEDISALADDFKALLSSGHIAMGERVRLFEEAFARFSGVPHAIAVSNGTAALEIICRALDLSGASVCVPANTFMATALAPIAAGAKIILVDVEPATMQMDPDDLARKIREDTRAVILVHLGGFISPRHERIAQITADAGAALIEDACHAHGATVFARKAGSIGLAGAFSFYPTKVLTTAEGGAITTADPELRDKALSLRQHGQSRPGSNVHEEFGLNYRPSEIHALLGLNLMPRAKSLLAARRHAARVYDRLLGGSVLEPIVLPPEYEPSYYKYIVRLPPNVARDELKERLLADYNLRLAGEVYATPLHRQPFWRAYPQTLAAPLGAFPGAEETCAAHVCLPIWPGLPEPDQEKIAEALLATVGKIGK